MPACSLCPGRSFRDDEGVRMHRESVHYCCTKCSKVVGSELALEQHTRNKHPFFECHYCDREFSTDDGRLAHERAKHPPTFECSHCDKEFSTDEGRLAHEEAKHPPTFECRHCDREFSTDDGRLAHEKAKHPSTFECHHCDREFSTDDGRLAHEEAKHPPTFECRYCDRELNTEHGRSAHEEAKHSVFECRYDCGRTFTSRSTRQQHEDANHNFDCNLCDMKFTEVAALREHDRITPHFECNYCPTMFFTMAIKKAHEVSCDSNPSNHVTTPTLTVSVQSGSSSSTGPEVVEEELSPSVVTVEGSKPPTSPSPSSQDEGELFHSTSSLPSTDANGEGPTVTQPCACTYSLEPGTCSRCQPSDTNNLVPDDAESVISADENHQDDSRDHRDAIFQCTPCFELFDTEESFRNHVCAFRTPMVRPHCPVCYTQFDDAPLLQEHLEGLEAFSCQLCLTRCCSDEMLEDHLLSHPTCGKCDMSFADNLALCAHVESDHPVVVCWDCDGTVVEKNSLELHYADSSAHPSCTICGVGKRTSADMDEHVRHVHATSAEMEDQPGAGNVNVGARYQRGNCANAFCDISRVWMTGLL
ncbi:hypothetical protein OG21DRAFT_1260009 [Imleria badia]|nr:hypothetical protein OG21DRAFT_1260009 [Imleria badia]